MNTSSRSRVTPAGYDSNVFVNCPFDEEYRKLIRPLLFTVAYLGFDPRLASERLDSGENRIDKITELIRASRYSIHDLSRLRASEPDEWYRLNMPFELGIDYGAREYGPGPLPEKRFLILETRPYDYQKALSDLSGVDIRDHGDDPDEVVRRVRDFLYEAADARQADRPKVVWYRFLDFAGDLLDAHLKQNVPKEDALEDMNRMEIPEYLDMVQRWVRGEELI